MTGAGAELRAEIVRTCLAMNELGINQGTSGNVSARCGDGLLITPSAVPYDQMRPEDVVELDADGGHAAGQLPSTEWRFHLALTKLRADVNAVVHTHSMFASIIAIRREAIPAVHYMIAAAGGPTIECARYATYGTQELADAAVEAIAGRNCCLLANHGLIAVGESLERALWLAKETEVLAQQYVYARLLGGAGPQVLDDAEIARVGAKFKDYGVKS